MAYLALRFDVDGGDADALVRCAARRRRARRSTPPTRARAPTDESADLRRARRAPRAAWWPLARLTALFAGGADVDAALLRAARALARAAPAFADASRSPTTTGCARRRRSSSRSAIADRLLDRAVVVHAAATRTRSTSRSIPGSRSAPARTRRRGCASRGSREHVAAGDIGARLRLRLGHPRHRRGEARRGPRRRHRHRSAGDRGERRQRARERRATPSSCSSTRSRAAAFDVVVANILANPLRVLAPALAARTRDGGASRLSGILADAGRGRSPRPTRRGSTSRAGARRRLGAAGGPRGASR